MVNEEITFSWDEFDIGEERDYRYKDLQPLEWLQFFADTLDDEANNWEVDCDPNFFEDHFESCKEEYPDMSKREMFSEAVDFVSEGFFHILWVRDLKNFKREIEALRENILKAFENSVIFPDILRSIGIIEFVSRLVEECLDSFWYDVHYCIAESPEEAEKYFKRRAAKRWKREAELTEGNYEKAFEGITEFFRTMEKRQFSQILRESAWAIQGYCKLKVGSEKYEETEERIKQRRKAIKEPSKEAIQAYMLRISTGWTQTEVAKIMTEKLKPEEPFEQYQISRLVTEARRWLKANNLDVFPEHMTTNILSTDPKNLEMGARQDGKITGDPAHQKKKIEDYDSGFDD